MCNFETKAIGWGPPESSYLPGSLLHPVGLSLAKGSHSSFWQFPDKWMFLLWDLGVTFICSLEGSICHQYEATKSPTPPLCCSHISILRGAYNRAGAEGPACHLLASPHKKPSSQPRSLQGTPASQGENSQLWVIYPVPGPDPHRCRGGNGEQNGEVESH